MTRKRRGGRRRFPLKKVSIQASSAVGALASLDVVTAAISQAGVDTYRLISVKAAHAIADLGAAIDDGFEFGYCHSDYTAAEVEECLESQAAMDMGDKVAQEQANRLVRKVGVISATGSPTAGGGLLFNGGMPVKTKLNWLMSIGDTLNIYVRNGTAVIYTTGSLLLSNGDLWIKVSA